MKYLVALVLLAAICAAKETKREDENSCLNDVINACSANSFSPPPVCTARYGGITHSEPELQAYANLLLTKSYQYLLMATYYNSYQKNRPGFQKLYQGLSDRSFDDTIDLIKHITRRGGHANFNVKHEQSETISKQPITLEQDELHSLALALESEKQLSRGALHIYSHAAHASETNRDAEIAHYVEEKFLGKQSETVRKLSGYANDLSKMMNTGDPSLAVYLFDDYLSKQ